MKLSEKLELLIDGFKLFMVCPRCNYKHKSPRRSCKCSFSIADSTFYGCSYEFTAGKYTVLYFKRDNITNVFVSNSLTYVLAVDGELPIEITEEEIDKLRLLI